MTLSRITLMGIILLAIMASGCVSQKAALSKYQTRYNFSDIKSYSTYDRSSEFSDFQNISDATRNSIELAIEQVFDKNGYFYAQVDKSDVVIGYHLIGNNNKELDKYNKGVGYCQYCLRGGEVAKGKKSWHMVPGSLILDVVNSKNNRSIWRSVYHLQIDEDDNSREVQKKIYQAIDNMIKRFPHNLTSSEQANG
jgi:hypothetical protein